MEIKVYTVRLDPPRWLRNVLVYFLLPVGLLASAVVAVRAADMLTTFMPGEKISSKAVNNNFTFLQEQIAQLQNNFGAKATSAVASTSVSSTSWVFLGGTPAVDVAADERVFVWNTAFAGALNFAGGQACTSCTGYSVGQLISCWRAIGSPATVTVGSQGTSVAPPYGPIFDADGAALSVQVTVADYFAFPTATSGVQFGLCAKRIGLDAVHRDFAVDTVNTMVLRAPVHGP